MFANLTPAAWPPLKAGMFASSVHQLPDHRAALDALQKDVLVGGDFSFRGLAIVGLADDEGIRLNSGRLGAKEGPDGFRKALARYGLLDSPALPAKETRIPIFDAGDVLPGRELTETHDRVTAAVSETLDCGLFPVGIGGGHDLTFPLVRAVASAASGPLDGIYFDAHLDVREMACSGMPFRRLVEDCRVQSLTCVGLDSLANSSEHLTWFSEHGGILAEFSPQEWPASHQQFVSIDLDVIDASHAPGVSAINPAGMSAMTIGDYAEAAGRSKQVCCFDIMELSPPLDEGGRTARLAAHLFLRFVQGCEQRAVTT